MEGPSGAGGGWIGFAVPVVCSSIAGAREVRLGGARVVGPGAGESGGRGASACGFAELYVAVRSCPQDRGRGWPGARTYSGQRARRKPQELSFPQLRGYMEVQQVAVCKTVGSAYVGSNPTPATTSENGPLAAETRPGGPFPSRHAMYQGGSPRVDAWQCPRTYSGQRPGETCGAYNRSLPRTGGRTGVVKTSAACGSPAVRGSAPVSMQKPGELGAAMRRAGRKRAAIRGICPMQSSKDCFGNPRELVPYGTTRYRAVPRHPSKHGANIATADLEIGVSGAHATGVGQGCCGLGGTGHRGRVSRSA